jgi:DNA-binding transcriptional ArsR family regulator
MKTIIILETVVLTVILLRLWYGKWLATNRAKTLVYLCKMQGSWVTGREVVQAGAASQGTVYFHLHQLEELGIIESKEDPDPKVTEIRGGVPRRLYRYKERYVVPFEEGSGTYN